MRKVIFMLTALALLFIFSGCETMDTVLKGAEVVGDIKDKAPVKGTPVTGLDFKKGEVLCSYREGRSLVDNTYYTAKILTPASAATKNQAEVLFVGSGKKVWSQFVVPSHKASEKALKLGMLVLFHVWANSDNMSADDYRKQYWQFGRISSTDELFKGKVEVNGKSMFVKWLRISDQPVE
jgi:hypothetical protein